MYRVRKNLYDNINMQDATFYHTHRTGDIMTRMSGDMDMVRHSVSWIIKNVLESLVLFIVSIVYFFSMDPITALCLIALTPVIFIASFIFKKKVTFSPFRRRFRVL